MVVFIAYCNVLPVITSISILFTLATCNNKVSNFLWLSLQPTEPKILEIDVKLKLKIDQSFSFSDLDSLREPF